MRVHINLPDDLVRDIDEIAGKGKRSECIADLVAAEVRALKLQEVIRRGAGILSDEDYPEWSTPEKVAEWLRDLRETPSIRRDPIEGIPLGLERLDRVAEGPASRYGTAPEAGAGEGGDRGERDIDG